ncbi:hypothetical protein FEE96_22830 [Parasedimentitalea maritima]|uniref:PilZ domain-containing protein n=1 Tax=Parasedimentitalea maritima TaxID=2578117 RepID=A0ABY2UNC5_9RHOB|nr:hypothetical protein [Zongyanglinia marina]TLP55311.1 hypothetical protein FEE96_22830 [Zongyanglinia marina]
MTSSKKTTTIRPPQNALRVKAWRDLPTNAAPARYKIIGFDGRSHEIIIAKGNRIILDALVNQPVYCASPVRIDALEYNSRWGMYRIRFTDKDFKAHQGLFRDLTERARIARVG